MKLKSFEVLDSTQDQIRREFQKDSKLKVLAVLARSQIRGRGSRGRKWSDVKDESFLLSLGFYWKSSWRPELQTFQSLIAGLAVYRVLKIKNHFYLKWPNDLIYKNKKVGGILVERPGGFQGRLWIVGIGINFSKAPRQLLHAGSLVKTMDFQILASKIYKEIRWLNGRSKKFILRELQVAMKEFWGHSTEGRGTWTAIGLTDQGELLVWNNARQRIEVQRQTRRRFVL